MVAFFTRNTTVINGSDTCGLFSQRPRTPNHGSRYFADDHQRSLVFDSRRQTWFPEDGRTFYDAAEKYLVDHFAGSALDAGYNKAAGIDSPAAIAAIVAGGLRGEVALVTGDVGDTVANDGSSLAKGLVWTPEDRMIVFGARFKLAAVTAVAAYLGLTDVLPETTLEMPFTLATSTFTSNATDAAGLLYDTAATTDTLRAVGVADDVDATHVDSAVVPVAATYLDMLMTVSTLGVAKTWINEVLKATLADAVNPATALSPVAVGTARTTTSQVLTLDYWFCHQDSRLALA